MRLLVLLAIFPYLALATTRCEFAALLHFLSRDKGHIENETLEEIAASQQPINPMIHDVSVLPTRRHAFSAAFTQILRRGIPPERLASVTR